MHVDILAFFLIFSRGFLCVAFEMGVICIVTEMYCVEGGLM